MLDASNASSFGVSSADRASAGHSNETLVQLLATATAKFDSDHEAARACLKQAAELLQVGGNPGGQRQNESRTSAGGLAAWQAKRVAAYVEANINSPFRVYTLAGIVELSVSHFSRVFKQTFGVPPHAYVTIQRVRRAQVMMMGSREPLAQIALDCGMADQSHFTRVFRKTVGINPARWRRQFPPGQRELTFIRG